MALNWLPYMTYADPFGHFQKAQQAKAQQEQQALANQMALQNQQMQKQEHELRLKEYQDKQRQAPAQQYQKFVTDAQPFIENIFRAPPEQQEQMFQSWKSGWLSQAYPELAGKAAATWAEAAPKWATLRQEQEGIKPTDDIREYEMAKTQGFDGSFMDYMTTVKKAGAQNINMPSINIPGGDKLGEASAKSINDIIVKSYEGAQDAVEIASISEDAEQLLDAGMTTGAFADMEIAAAKVAQKLGFPVDEANIANTEAYAAFMGNAVAKIIRAFGAGTGLSDKDREYAEKIAAGQIKLTEKSLRKLLSLNKKYAAKAIEKHQRNLGKAPKEWRENFGDFYSVEVPKMAEQKPEAPAGDGWKIEVED